MLTDDQKIKSLSKFCKKLRYSQRIVFSDEGNLEEQFDDLKQREKSWYKPSGLWYGFGRSWIGYLETLIKYEHDVLWAKKRLSQITHIYRLTLNDTILRVHTEKEMAKFENEYATKGRRGVWWSRLAEKYNGIEIRFHYSYMKRSEDNWYDGWDVSSGCVWNKSGIKKINLLKSWTPYWDEK